MDDARRDNRDNWDDRVAIHWGPDGYDAPGFIADPSRISGTVEADRDVLGDVAGKRLLHLQCHFGKDTLSWARLGAVVTGIDFSPKAITAARRMSAESGTPGRFIESELYAAPEVLDEQFDIVVTGVGAINWLPDIRGWADVVDHFLAPGGTFYLREGHPMLWSLDHERADDLLVVRHPYFEGPVQTWDDAVSYAGTGMVEHTRHHEWSHGLSEVIGSLLDVGLTLTHFAEHREVEWPGLDLMKEGSDGRWRLPLPLRDRVPLMYTVMATKPA
ncbi:MAG: class I SAM-dependent methyltransferase [Acidimicrobiia bacterium]